MNHVTGSVVIKRCMACANELGVRITMSGERSELGVVWCAQCVEIRKAKDEILKILVNKLMSRYEGGPDERIVPLSELQQLHQASFVEER